LFRNAKAVFEEKEGDIMPTLAEQWIKQGIQRGLQQGVQQGTLRGTRAMVVEALRTKFNAVPTKVVKQIEKIDDTDVLTHLLRKFLHVRDMEEFKAALAQI